MKERKVFMLVYCTGRMAQRMKEKEIFEELPLIFREKGSGTRQTMEKYIERRNLSVLKKMELTSKEAV